MPRGRPRKARASTTPAAETATPESNGSAGRKVNKFAAVRRALKKLGTDATPERIQRFIRRGLKVEMPKTLISQYKSVILRKQAGAGTQEEYEPRPTRRTWPIVNGTVRGAAGVEDVRTVKALVGRLGAEAVRELIDILAE